MRYFLLVMLVGVPIIASGVTHEVTMVGLTFVPETLTVNQNDSVLWVNTSAISHTTTSGAGGVPSGYWDSGLMPPNDSFFFYFDSVGVFPYYCTPHWTLGMVGLITVEPLGIQEYDVPSSVAFDMSQAYPNPSAGTVRIDYALKVAGQVSIDIYSSTGQKIRTLADTRMPSGEYSAAWDGLDSVGKSVPMGTYFLRLSVNGNRQERKLLLIR